MKKIKQLLSIGVCFLIAVLNQNCGEQSSFNGNQELAISHSPSILDIDLPSSKARVGDRIFVASVFASVFLPQTGSGLSKAQVLTRTGLEALHLQTLITSTYDSTKDDMILNEIIDIVLKNVQEFHGPCSVLTKDASCSPRSDRTMRTIDAKASSIAPTSVTKEGYRLSACKNLSDSTRAIENAVLNATGDRETNFQVAYIMDIYDLFYPGQKISEEAYNALVDAATAVAAAGESQVDQWRSVIIPICYSAGWQIP